MKKTFAMRDLECANCAAKMERAIALLDGVSFVRVNFLMQRITIEADDEAFEQILQKADKICKRYEPDCTILL